MGHARLCPGSFSSIVRVPKAAKMYLGYGVGQRTAPKQLSCASVQARPRYSSAALYFVRLTHACGHVRGSPVALAALV